MKSTPTRPGHPYLKGALGIAALSAARSNDTYFSTKYRRIASHRGPIKAVVAIERAMLVVIWNMLATGGTYSDPGGDYFTKRRPERANQRALDQRRDLGDSVTLEPSHAVASSRTWRWAHDITIFAFAPVECTLERPGRRAMPATMPEPPEQPTSISVVTLVRLISHGVRESHARRNRPRVTRMVGRDPNSVPP